MKLVEYFRSVVRPRRRLPAAKREATAAAPEVRRRGSARTWTPTLGSISEDGSVGGGTCELVATVHVAEGRTKAAAEAKGRAKAATVARVATPSHHRSEFRNVGFPTMALAPTPFLF